MPGLPQHAPRTPRRAPPRATGCASWGASACRVGAGGVWAVWEGGALRAKEQPLRAHPQTATRMPAILDLLVVPVWLGACVCWYHTQVPLHFATGSLREIEVGCKGELWNHANESNLQVR